METHMLIIGDMKRDQVVFVRCRKAGKISGAYEGPVPLMREAQFRSAKQETFAVKVDIKTVKPKTLDV